MEASLARLKAYRKRDPGFREAIAAFVEAEATFEDPVEGRVTEEATDATDQQTCTNGSRNSAATFSS